ncbi:MAG: hypothetical protein Q8N06_02940 [Hydrogenophaga sp.]|nr:hypothetical protein [Hydrogenophaga sp.]
MTKTSIQELHEWLSQLQALVEAKTCKSPAFLRPFHLATLALVLKGQRAAEVGIPDHLMDYANRMHLWQAIGLKPPASAGRERDSSGRFLPVEPLVSRDAVNECSKRLAAMTDQADLDKRSQQSLDTSVSELVDNCFAHAGLVEPHLHGVACAQLWLKGNLGQIAIADRGMGIRRSLENAETEEIRGRVRSSNSCELATELGVTSKPSHHAGYGLALARQLMHQNGGTLMVVSGQEWFCGTGNSTHSGDRGVNWPGTLIVCEFNTERPLRVSEVYASWPPVRGYTNDDFDL